MKQTVKRFKIALNFIKMSVDELLTFAAGIANGLINDPDATAPPVNSGTLFNEIGTVNPPTALAGTHAKRKSDKSETLTKLEQQQANLLTLSLTKDAHYVEDTANDIANGDESHFLQIITRIGFQPKKKPSLHPRDFEVVEIGKGWIHLRAKKTHKGPEAHCWQYGVTAAENTPPTALGKVIVTLEADIIIHDLTSAAIYGFQHASIVPVSHTKKTSPKNTANSKNATPVPLSKSKHPMFSNGDDPQQFSGFIYEVIR